MRAATLNKFCLRLEVFKILELLDNFFFCCITGTSTALFQNIGTRNILVWRNFGPSMKFLEISEISRFLRIWYLEPGKDKKNYWWVVVAVHSLLLFPDITLNKCLQLIHYIESYVRFWRLELCPKLSLSESESYVRLVKLRGMSNGHCPFKGQCPS